MIKTTLTEESAGATDVKSLKRCSKNIWLVGVKSDISVSLFGDVINSQQPVPTKNWMSYTCDYPWVKLCFSMDHKVQQAWKCSLNLYASTRWAASTLGASPWASLSNLLPCSGGTEYLQIKRQRWKCCNQNTAKHHQSRMKSDLIWKYGTGNKEQDKEKWVFEERCNISLAWALTISRKKMNYSI